MAKAKDKKPQTDSVPADIIQQAIADGKASDFYFWNSFSQTKACIEKFGSIGIDSSWFGQGLGCV